MVETNWFGMVPHTTDSLISIYDDHPEIRARKLRVSYNSIINSHVDNKLYVDILLDAAFTAGYTEAESDRNKSE